MDRLREMEVFVEVAETESFSSAARRLNMSTSAVSKHIASLEERLGVRLLNRTTRRVSLTETGAAWRERSKRILAEMEEAELAVTSLHTDPRGTLQINAPMSYGRLHVAPLVHEFLERYPDIMIDLQLNDRYVDVISEGFDLAIRIGQLADSSLVARRIAPATMHVAASPAYIEAHGRPASPDDLLRHNCLVYSLFAGGSEWIFEGPDGSSRRIAVTGRMRANNGEALATAAVNGQGIVCMPDFIIGEHLADGRLVRLLGEYHTRELAVHAVYPHNRHLSTKVRTFIDFLVEKLGR